MTRRNPSGPLLFYSEIESTTCRNRREIRRSLQYIEEEHEDDTNTTEEMAENQNNQLPPMVAADPINQNLAPRTILMVCRMRIQILI